ncbi:deoxyribodipyrimidine photo-lyase [Devosia sp. 1635]|uniref:deoxyribodipyrimidine photo-lyase n=1 Tax=Devosia sp. 1635 TaxID=2726066 RepID=UPI0020C09678|nr:deoxyribodipyrimidine photo-lyase [Devosia sp. 1635]
MAQTAIAWLRNDLRMADNPALMRAAQDGRRVIVLYVHETTSGIRLVGAAGRWWLHQSLARLSAALAGRGIMLEVRTGETEKVLAQTVSDYDAVAVYWNRRYGPAARALDARIKDTLQAQGIGAESLPGNVLAEPWTLATGQDRPYSVYTPF